MPSLCGPFASLRQRLAAPGVRSLRCPRSNLDSVGERQAISLPATTQAPLWGLHRPPDGLIVNVVVLEEQRQIILMKTFDCRPHNQSMWNMPAEPTIFSPL